MSWWSMVKSLPITLKAYLPFQLLSIEGSSLFQTVLVVLVDLALSFPSSPPGLLSLLDPYEPSWTCLFSVVLFSLMGCLRNTQEKQNTLGDRLQVSSFPLAGVLAHLSLSP